MFGSLDNKAWPTPWYVNSLVAGRIKLRQLKLNKRTDQYVKIALRKIKKNLYKGRTETLVNFNFDYSRSVLKVRVKEELNKHGWNLRYMDSSSHGIYCCVEELDAKS